MRLLPSQPIIGDTTATWGWTFGVSAVTDHAGTSSTYDSRDFELRESFCVRVWEVNDPESEVTVEMRIVDKDAPLYEFAEVEYLYDHQNQTVGRVFDVDGEGEEDPTFTFYSYQDGQVVLQFDGTEDTDLAHRFFWNPTAIDQLFADEQVGDDVVLWALTDQQGTVHDLATHNSTAHTTTVVLHRNYDAYGNLVGASGSLLDGHADEGSNRLTTAATDALFNYTGRFFDTSTWLQYNLNRWYDATTGRWISEDPIGFEGDPWNLYRYVGNSPTNRTDSTGLVGVHTQAETDTLGSAYQFLYGDVLVTFGVDASLSKSHAIGSAKNNPVITPDWLGLYIRTVDQLAGQPAPGGGTRVWASAVIKTQHIIDSRGQTLERDEKWKRETWYQDMPGYKPTVQPFDDYPGVSGWSAVLKLDGQANLHREYGYAIAILCQNANGTVNGKPLWSLYYSLTITATGSSVTVVADIGSPKYPVIQDWSKLVPKP